MSNCDKWKRKVRREEIPEVRREAYRLVYFRCRLGGRSNQTLLSVVVRGIDRWRACLPLEEEAACALKACSRRYYNGGAALYHPQR